jgi:hypothetical protein
MVIFGPAAVVVVAVALVVVVVPEADGPLLLHAASVTTIPTMTNITCSVVFLVFTFAPSLSYDPVSACDPV